MTSTRFRFTVAAGLLLAVVALFSMSVSSTPEAQAASHLNEPIPDSVLVVSGGLQWAWASPCNGGCSQITIRDGFRYATAQEWANRPSYALFTNPEKCASPYFDQTHNHCDKDDLDSGYVASGPNFDPAQPQCASPDVCETLLVRNADPNAILKGLQSQINCSPFLYSGGRLLLTCLTLKTTIKLAMIPHLACYEIMLSLSQVQYLHKAGGISAETAASWSSQLASAATLRQCPGYTSPALVPAGLAPAAVVAGSPAETLASE